MNTLSTYLTPGKQEDLRQGWVQLLSCQPWHEMATLTYRPARRVHDALIATKQATNWLYRRIWDHATKIGDNIRSEVPVKPDAYGNDRMIRGRDHEWTREMKIKCRGRFGTLWHKRSKKPIWVCGVEVTSLGDLHCHMLIRHRYCEPGTPNEIRRDAGWDLWFNQLDMGRCRIEPPNSREDVAGYVSKYVAKGMLTLSPTFKADRQWQAEAAARNSQGKLWVVR